MIYDLNDRPAGVGELQEFFAGKTDYIPKIAPNHKIAFIHENFSVKKGVIRGWLATDAMPNHVDKLTFGEWWEYFKKLEGKGHDL